MSDRRLFCRCFRVARFVLASGWVCFGFVLGELNLHADDPPPISTAQGDALVTEYFRTETAALSTDVVEPGMTREQLQSRQEIDRRHLTEMLGLEPMPERTPLKVEILETSARDGFRVQRLHFQPSPGLYVAANLYLPLEVTEPLPTILYVCGHSRQVKDGVSFGNKAGYHHHGIWFARNGYVCLIVDTIQWGEFLGDHHGTYRLGRWWWNNRGYTPAGVEAWTGMRALDYLESREEVDADRFGITGRSGGGVYSWWIAALDKRIKVAVPVAGITTLDDYVVNGCVEGHCDCMFMVNTYRWDYPRVAALVAPRPLLISNSDKDRIFPLEGVIETHRQVRDVYRLYEAGDKLGLQITEGPHKDTQELRVHAFRWFNRFLKNDDSLIDITADKMIEPTDLRIFEKLPADERVTSADEWFVPKSSQTSQSPKQRLQLLKEKTFAGWPSEAETLPLNVEQVDFGMKNNVACTVFDFDSQLPYRLRLFVLTPADRSANPPNVRLEVLGQQDWDAIAPGLSAIVPKSISGTVGSSGGISDASAESLLARFGNAQNTAVVFFAPRGVGATEWSRDEKKRTHILRRFMLLGQTADAMRIWDVRRAIAAVREMPDFQNSKLRLVGKDHAAAWALYASLFDSPVDELQMIDLPKSNRDGISLLNVSRIAEIDDVVKMAANRTKLIKN